MALLVNPRGGRSRKKIDIAAVFKRAGVKANPRKNRARARKKARSGHHRGRYAKNPTVAARKNRRKHRKSRANPHKSLRMNRRRRSAKRRNYRKNPLTVNRRRSYRKNPLTVNPSGNLVSKITRPVAGIVSKLPIVGKSILGPAVLLMGGAAAGAVSTYALHFAMDYLDEYVPDMVKPFGYTIGGSLLAAVLLKAPKFPMQREVAMALPVAGAAIDAWRYIKGASSELGELGGFGVADMPDDGAPHTSYEYEDADLLDAELGSDDLDEEECQMAALGRRAWWNRFRYSREHRHPGKSYHAGRPGGRHGWLIYILGFDNFRQLASMPMDQRRQYIRQFRIRAHELASQMLQGGVSTDVKSAQMSGLLVNFAS